MHQRISASSIILLLAIALWTASSSVVVRAADPKGESIELFVGIDSGELEVKIIAKDATKGNVIIENKTAKPLTVKLPDAVAAVPVLAQLGCPGGGCPGGGGGNQGMGGGMMGGMGGGGMMGGGMFNIGPERVVKLKTVTVCLEHGKKDPSPHVEYKLVKLESFAKNEAAQEVVRMLARGDIDQHSAQAAVWHLENGLSWQELAQKIGVKHLNGTVEPYFTQVHLLRALWATRIAESRASKSGQSQESASAPANRGDE